MQHHDAITGTHKDAVGKNYESLMEISSLKMEKSIKKALYDLSWSRYGLRINLDNKTQFNNYSNEEEIFLVYNPYLTSIKHLIFESKTPYIAF